MVKAVLWRFKLLFSVFSVALLLSSSLSASPLRCENLFSDLDQLTIQRIQSDTNKFMTRFNSQKMSSKMAASLFDSIETLLADTTGKRVENKVTSSTEGLLSSLKNFRTKLSRIGAFLVDRDKLTPGLRNVTYTEYTKPFQIKLRDMHKMGFDLRPGLADQLDTTMNVKIRIRSYGTVSEQKKDFGLDDIEFAQFTKDRAFVELKFKDPSYEGAVFKPQMYMKKEYTKLFGTADFLRRFDEIKLDTLQNLKISDKKTLDETSVEAMLEFLREAHIEQQNLDIVAVNLYERSAKSLTLNYHSDVDPGFNRELGEVKSIELQMTFDQLISLYLPGKKGQLGEAQYYHSYNPDQTVSEFKTPTVIAHHLKRAQEAAFSAGRIGLLVTKEHAELLEKVCPGLKEYFELMNEVIEARDTSKELNRGKWGTALKKIKNEIENFLNQFYAEDYEVAPSKFLQESL